MVRISILYPSSPGARFDFGYYETVHMPLAAALLGPAMVSISVERGLSPGAPWPDPAFVAICDFVCESREIFEAAYGPNRQRLQADMPNYTDIEPVIQIGEPTLCYGASASLAG